MIVGRDRQGGPFFLNLIVRGRGEYHGQQKAELGSDLPLEIGALFQRVPVDLLRFEAFLDFLDPRLDIGQQAFVGDLFQPALPNLGRDPVRGDKDSVPLEDGRLGLPFSPLKENPLGFGDNLVQAVESDLERKPVDSGLSR